MTEMEKALQANGEKLLALTGQSHGPHFQCGFPVVAACGGCCGHSPCDLEWYRPCDEQGGCIDRATCGGCDTPVTLKPQN